LRAIYTFDEDLVPPPSLRLATKPLNIIDYETGAWPDFIAHQLAPFGSRPIFLTPGNHEIIPPATRDANLIQFADWLETPAIRNHRLRNDPKDHTLRAYYHWIDRGIDFIALDNASREPFDPGQLKWFHDVLSRDEASDQVRTVVVGMHAARGKLRSAHSMSDWPPGEASGREVYQALLHTRDVGHKRVYLLASHSHCYLDDVCRTDTWKGRVLPGWIIGTAGAVRYLPAGTVPGPKVRTDVYGYLIGTVASDGAISFSFHKLSVADLLRTRGQAAESLVHWCNEQNKQ